MNKIRLALVTTLNYLFYVQVFTGDRIVWKAFVLLNLKTLLPLINTKPILKVPWYNV